MQGAEPAPLGPESSEDSSEEEPELRQGRGANQVDVTNGH